MPKTIQDFVRELDDLEGELQDYKDHNRRLIEAGRQRGPWFRSGLTIGLVGGIAASAVIFAWSTFLVDERIVSAAILGVTIGAGGYWAIAIHDRDLFRSRRRLDDYRKQIARLTRALQAYEDRDD